MREYNTPIDIPLRTGIRPDIYGPESGASLRSLVNGLPDLGGIRPLDKLVRSLYESGGVSLDLSAQIFPTSVAVYVLTTDKLYTYDGAKITLVLSSIPIGGIWTCADFGRYIVFGNGVVNLIRNVSTGAFTVDTGTIIPLRTVLYGFLGRLIIASGNVLEWSRMGSIEFASESAGRAAQENSSGGASMNWAGNILLISSIGQEANARLVVYGDNGITTAGIKSVEPFALNTLGFSDVYDLGISNARAHAVAGPNLQFFVGTDGELYALSNEGIKRIGYKEYINKDTATLGYDALNRRLYIGGALQSLVLGRNGAGLVSANINSLCFDKRVGLVIHSTSGISQPDIELTTDTLDFSWPGLKMLQSVWVQGTVKDKVYVAAEYRSEDSSDTFYTSDWSEVAPGGSGFIGVSGFEFRLKVRVENYTGTFIRGLRASVQYIDKRFVKGANINNGNQTIARSGE